MKRLLTLGFLSFVVTATAADSFHVTAQLGGTPVKEAARDNTRRAGIRALPDGKSEPLRATIHSGLQATLEQNRDYRYPTVLVFDKSPETPIEAKNFVSKTTGVKVVLTATRDGEHVVFHGTCTVRRPASSMMAKAATPKDQANVTAMTFITRECDFAGRTPIGTPAKVNLGEDDVDTGNLTLTFVIAK